MSVEGLESRVLLAGRVDFVPYYETGSSWWDPVHGPAYRQSVEDMLGQFEAVLRTSGTWDASIEVFFKEDGTTAYASTSNANYADVSHLGSAYRAVGAWREIVQGAADDNGTTINLTNGDGSETEIDWNFSLSTPDRNPGLLRHELLHSLGMTSYLSNEMPTMAQDGSITKSNVGGVTPAYVYDSRIVDLNRNPVLGGHVSGINYTVNNYAVDNDWDDQNGSGLAFHAIADDGGDLYLELTSWNSDGVRNGTGIGTRVGSVQSSHPLDVSYAYAHPTWNTLAEVDRALLRAMGYTIPPVAAADAITVAEGGTATELVGGATSVLTNDTDAGPPDGTLTVSTMPVVAPLHGALTLNADGTFQYVHDGSENFADSFTYRVSDAANRTAQATVTITVTPVNDNPPVAVADAITVDEGGTATVLMSGAASVLTNDTDGDLPNDMLTVSTTPVVAPLHGTLTLHADGTFQYVHDGSENFADSFTYQVSDAASHTAQATVTIAVTKGSEATWHNAANPYDVNGRDGVTPLDVLEIINYINSHPGETNLPPAPGERHPFVDVNNLGDCTPLDVLLVIAYINSRQQGSPEGESSPTMASRLTSLLVAPAGSGRDLTAPSLDVLPRSTAVPADLPAQEHVVSMSKAVIGCILTPQKSESDEVARGMANARASLFPSLEDDGSHSIFDQAVGSARITWKRSVEDRLPYATDEMFPSWENILPDFAPDVDRTWHSR